MILWVIFLVWSAYTFGVWLACREICSHLWKGDVNEGSFRSDGHYLSGSRKEKDKYPAESEKMLIPVFLIHIWWPCSMKGSVRERGSPDFCLLVFQINILCISTSMCSESSRAHVFAFSFAYNVSSPFFVILEKLSPNVISTGAFFLVSDFKDRFLYQNSWQFLSLASCLMWL